MPHVFLQWAALGMALTYAAPGAKTPAGVTQIACGEGILSMAQKVLRERGSRVMRCSCVEGLLLQLLPKR